MISDIPKIMEERGIDAIVVFGGFGNPDEASWTYLKQGTSLDSGQIILRRDGKPIVVASESFSGNAAKEVAEKLEGEVFDSDLLYERRKKLLLTEPTTIIANAKAEADLLQELGIKGRVSFYGATTFENAAPYLHAINSALKGTGIELFDEKLLYDSSTIEIARQTKSDSELAKIIEIGMRAKCVFMDVESLLGVCDIKDGQLYYEGKPLRINNVKKLVEETSREFGFDIASEPPIFSMGVEAAQFHNRGSSDVVLRPGETIIFDFFPRDERRKYWWDQTRTYVVGCMPKEIKKAYVDVLRIQEEIINSLKPGMLWRDVDLLAHKLMEEAGYATLESPVNQKGFKEGYGHAIGHGVGLNIHEAPWLRYTWKGDDVLKEGMVFSIEPGVYFPNAKKPYGIRIEDLVVMTERGAEILVEHPKTLEDAVIQI